MSSENALGADNQQERLDAYIAGYVDGEGSFHVAIQRNPSTRLKWQLVPEFHVSQNADRRQVLDLIAKTFACGRIRENHSGTVDKTLVFIVRNRRDLLERVIPFFERQPLVSSKQQDFERFAFVVKAMSRGEHLTQEGFSALKAVALAMNGAGKYRTVHVSNQNPQRPYAEHHEPGDGEDMVRPAWRHAEPGRNDLALDLDRE
jgi:hypothetical protein